MTKKIGRAGPPAQPNSTTYGKYNIDPLYKNCDILLLFLFLLEISAVSREVLVLQ